MKANKAPEKIYLQVCGDCKGNDCKNCKFEDLEDNITWCKDKIFEKDIEYVRKDAFINEVCEWLDDELCCYIKAQDFSIDHPRLNKDLRKHLEDEV